MSAHGDVIRSREVFPVHGLRAAGQEGAERQSLPDRVFVFLMALAAILGVGVILYGFHQALQTLTVINLPPYWPVTF